jgi:replicative DNA helicase
MTEIKIGKVLNGVIRQLKQGNASTELPDHCVSTGYANLDSRLNGFYPGDLVFLMGCSFTERSFAINLAWNIASKGNKTSLIFSNQMSPDDVAVSIASKVGEVNKTRIRHPRMLKTDDWEKLNVASTKIGDAPIYIPEFTVLELDEIFKITKKLIEGNNTGILIIDNFQILCDQESKKSISQILTSIKQLAWKLQIPVLILTEIKTTDEREDKRPILSDIPNFELITPRCEVIIGVYVDAHHNVDSEKEDIADIIICKNSHGTIGITSLGFKMEYHSFDDCLEKD